MHHLKGLLVGLAVTSPALAFESAKVLPAGVRNVNVRTVNTNIEQKTDADGKGKPLAQPLAQSLTFSKIAKSEEALAAKQLEGFLLTQGMTMDDMVGAFTADLKGHIGVAAGIFSYGVSEKLTLAIAAPYYRASTAIEVGFRKNETGQRFLNALAKPENNNQASAQEAGGKLNNAVGRLNDKLRDNGFRALEDWHDEGLGDMTLAGKYQVFKRGDLAAATTAGVVAPTGRPDDPEILNDVAFGDGQFDVFGQVATDQPLFGDVVANEYAKYTVQLPGERDMRMTTEDESIEVDKQETKFKLGDKVDAGLSLVYQPPEGVVAGLGYTYFRKYGDIYRDVPGAVKSKLEGGTDQVAHNGEAQLGFSTVPLYQRGAFAVPFEMKLTYTKQLESRNMPITDLAQFDLNLFF